MANSSTTGRKGIGVAGRDQRAQDAARALSDYRAAQLASDAKTTRLRALRLARDAAAEEPGTKSKRPTKKVRKDASGVAARKRSK